MDRSNTAKFDEEVNELYKLLQKKENAIVSPLFEIPKLAHPESKRIGKRYILIPFALALSLAVVGWIFHPNEWLKFIILVLTLVGYIGIIAVQILELYADKGSILQFLKNPLIIFINSLVEESAHEMMLAAELKKFSNDSLEMVKRSLEVGHLAISQRIGIFVGVIDKTGVLPGLVTLYFAAASKTSQQVAVLVAVAMFVIYIFAFAVHHALPRLNYYISLIDFELKRRKN
ncbi:hypothetical protein [Methylomicrobium album]|uniref:Uncharacterized protein n=1 Tax=Methylomicrobium album BG8 TaxID=686340 RepID=H8GJA3_METAL|nr:hypothetical protein [Methylomicrobium album]EIC29093.1 hypothetical protein Metal_1293 [Methylomicrobium album BG8]